MSTLQTDREGRTLTVRINRPPRNFMNRQMVSELHDLLDSLEGDGSTGAVVITGGIEGTFITHYDVEEILAGSEGVGMEVSAGVASASLRTIGGLSRVPGGRTALKRTPAAGLLELHSIHDLFLRMNRMDKVFVAAINGPALGGGCELALACDVRYMAEEAGAIGLPEMTLGLIPGAGGTQRLSRVLGTGRALEMILEGRPLSPDEALEVGLVHRVVPEEDLLDEAWAAATRFARRAPESIAGVKRAVLEGSSKPLPEGLAIERKWFISTASKPACQRAMRAYAEQISSEEAPAWTDPETLRPWREGTVVDLTGDAAGGGGSG